MRASLIASARPRWSARTTQKPSVTASGSQTATATNIFSPHARATGCSSATRTSTNNLARRRSAPGRIALRVEWLSLRANEKPRLRGALHRLRCQATRLAEAPAAAKPFAVAPEAAFVPVAAAFEIKAVRIERVDRGDDFDRRAGRHICNPRAGIGMVEAPAMGIDRAWNANANPHNDACVRGRGGGGGKAAGQQGCGS